MSQKCCVEKDENTSIVNNPDIQFSVMVDKSHNISENPHIQLSVMVDDHPLCLNIRHGEWQFLHTDRLSDTVNDNPMTNDISDIQIWDGET